MVLAVNRAVAAGARAVVCASTGNTSASAAAYARRRGPALPRDPAGGQGGPRQDGPGAGGRRAADHGRRQLRRGAGRGSSPGRGWTGGGGQLDQPRSAHRAADGRVRDRRRAGRGARTRLHCRSATPATSPPTGAASARYADAGRTPGAKLPRMLGFQAEGAAPIVRGEPVESPETVATAIRIGNPASWQQAVAARDESGGLIEAVTDDEILDAQRMVARLEGVFCEPASAAGVAGVRRLAARAAHRRGRDGRVRAHRSRPQGSGRRSGRGGLVDADPGGSRQHPARDGDLRPAHRRPGRLGQAAPQASTMAAANCSGDALLLT